MSTWMLCYSLNSSACLKYFIFNMMRIWKCWQRCWNTKVMRQQSEVWETQYSSCQEKHKECLKYIYKYLKISKNKFHDLRKNQNQQTNPPSSSVEYIRMEKEQIGKDLEEISLNRAVADLGVHISFCHNRRGVRVSSSNCKLVETWM